MKSKLKKCLATLVIIVTCFCIVDNNFVVSKFFASFIMPSAYADATVPGEEGPSDEEKDALLPSRVVAIARQIAEDTYRSPHFDDVYPDYTYLWGGDGELDGRRTGIYDGYRNSYCVFDCRGFVSACYRYAAMDYDMDDVIKNLAIPYTDIEYSYLTQQIGYGWFGCHKVTSISELKDGDILLRTGHTEIFAWGSDGSPHNIGAHETSYAFNRGTDGKRGTCEPEDSISEYNMGTWECYFRYKTTSTYTPNGSVRGPVADGSIGNLGPDREYMGPVDSAAELDEQIFDFQGNPQTMIFEGETNFSLWLFSLLSQFLDFISGLLVSLLINPIMQLLNAIVNFLTNFINHISGLPTGT